MMYDLTKTMNAKIEAIFADSFLSCSQFASLGRGLNQMDPDKGLHSISHIPTSNTFQTSIMSH